MYNKSKNPEQDNYNVAKIYVFLWIILLFMPSMLDKKLSGTSLIDMRLFFAAASFVCAAFFCVCFFKRLVKSPKRRIYGGLLAAVAAGELLCLSMDFNYAADRIEGVKTFEGSRYMLTEYEDGGSMLAFYDGSRTKGLILSVDETDTATLRNPALNSENDVSIDGYEGFKEHQYPIRVSYYDKTGIVSSIEVIRQ